VLSTSPTVRAHRARVAALTRYRDSTDPELVEARTRLREEAFLAAVVRAVAIAPPMKPAIRDRVISLLPAEGAAA
jgi:hypothetical protein